MNLQEIDEIATNLKTLKEQISQEAKKHNRNANAIKLIAVSKKKPIEAIKTAYMCGQRDFAENYPQELAEKSALLKNKQIIWHFIGQIQSNKTKLIATHAKWVHSLYSIKTAQKLNRHCEQMNKKLQVCIQINLLNETQKKGIKEADIFNFANEVIKLEYLELRGVMFIAPFDLNEADLKVAFLKINELHQKLQTKLQNQNLKILSFGMSSDWKLAVECGSTAIRIGTAIFGKRLS